MTPPFVTWRLYKHCNTKLVKRKTIQFGCLTQTRWNLLWTSYIWHLVFLCACFWLLLVFDHRCLLDVVYEEYRAFILDLFQRLQILIFNLSFPWNLLSENLRQFISDPSRERAICEFKNTCDSIYKSIFKWQALWKLYKWRYYIALQMRILYNIFHHKNDISWSIRRTG